MLKTPFFKWKLALSILPLVIVIVLIKFVIHYYQWEFLTLNSLFSALISANVFLVSFLISGVLADYKEAEKLPGDLACSIESICDEAVITFQNKRSKVALNLINHLHALNDSLLSWFHKQTKTGVLLNEVSELNTYFLQLEPLTQANFISRLKVEQNQIRRMITRIHTIRETDFNPSGYAIAEIITIVLCIGLVFTKIDPYYESIFFVAFVSFILIYMIKLIRDIDNPFGYYKKENMAA